MPDANSKPFMHNISIRNFKVLKQLTISTLNWVNIIGGANGVGKSTLLEAVFYFMNQHNPHSFNFMMRKYGPQSLSTSLFKNMPFFFSKTTEAGGGQLSVCADTNFGKMESSTEFKADDRREIRLPLGINGINAENNLPTSALRPENMMAESITKLDGDIKAFYSYIRNNASSVRVDIKQAWSGPVMPVSYLSRDVKYGIAGLPTLLSRITEDGLLPAVIEFLNVLTPGITDLRVMTDGQVQQVSAKARKWMPITSYGGGAALALGLCLCIIKSTNGVCCLEHMESEIHHLKLSEFWKAIGLLAKKFKCQLFFTTHSHENIQEAFTGLKDAGLLSSLQYIRLSRNTKQDENFSDVYTDDLLSEALSVEYDPR